LGGVGTVGDQQQRAGGFFGLQQAPGLFDYRRYVLAGPGDQVGAQGLDKTVEQCRVVGGGQDQMGTACIGNQGRTGTVAPGDQIMQFVLGGFQSGGLHIAGIH